MNELLLAVLDEMRSEIELIAKAAHEYGDDDYRAERVRDAIDRFREAQPTEQHSALFESAGS